MITCQGEYTDDINRANKLYLRVLRSSYAHGYITELDIADALISPGVKAIYLAKDIVHLGTLPCRAVLKDAQGNAAHS